MITIVLDEVKSKKGAEIETRFHSDCNTEITDKYVLLEGKKGTMALIPVVDGEFSIRPGKHPYLPVRKEASFQWIPYFGTVVNSKKEQTVIATIILPVKDENEVRAIVDSVKRTTDSSGNLTLSFVKYGNTYKYFYKYDRNQLILAK